VILRIALFLKISPRLDYLMTRKSLTSLAVSSADVNERSNLSAKVGFLSRRKKSDIKLSFIGLDSRNPLKLLYSHPCHP